MSKIFFMTRPPFSRLFAAGIVHASAGTLPDGNGGAVCKGAGSCLVLELECKGTYTDATQKDGTVYGKCSQTASVSPGLKINRLAR